MYAALKVELEMNLQWSQRPIFWRKNSVDTWEAESINNELLQLLVVENNLRKEV